jgi:ABC-type lipoprotein release transport system permease subunit
MSRTGVILKLSLRNVFRNRRHSLYALATITIGSMGLLVFMGFNRGTMDEYRENTIRARWGHGQLYMRGYRGTAHEQPREKWIENPAEAMGKLRAMPPAPGLTRGLRIFIELAPTEALRVLSLTAVTSVAGSLLPIWRATRIPIVEALRHV